MTENTKNEVMNKRKLGDKKFHSETSLYNVEGPSDEDKDPGVVNETLSAEADDGARRRTVSQPGPAGGALLTATAARATRKRPMKNVMYAAEPARTDSIERQSPRFLSPMYLNRLQDDGDSLSLPENTKNEVMNKRKLGDKKFHSETSLYNVEGPSDEDKDPGVVNETLSAEADDGARRRTVSQPGPAGGALLTATAARATRKRPMKNVMYAAEPARTDSIERQSPRFLSPMYLNRLQDDGDSLSLPVERASPQPYGRLNADARSINSYRLYAPNERGGTTPRKRSVVTMDAQSIRSVDTHAPPPTSPEDNRKMTLERMSISVSCIYAILLVTLGIIVYISDHFVSDISIAPIYSIILCSIGFMYMMFLIIDIGRYKSVASANMKIKSKHDDVLVNYFKKHEMDFGPSTPGEGTPETGRTPFSLPPPNLIPQNHDYCFNQGRHAGSFYLKLGAAGFALGHLVHSLLLITVQIGYLLDDTIDNDECLDYMQMAIDVMNPLYCFFQLYFVFKYSNVIIMKGQNVARFAFMHYIGTSLCFWVSAIVRETVLALTLYAGTRYGGDYNSTYDDNATSSATPLFIDISNLYNENCVGSAAITSIYQNLSPYLYPFSVEFNIFIVAMYYVIWNHIGSCGKESENSNDDDMNSSLCETVTCKIPTANEDNDFSSNIVIYADCHASNRGLFAGLMLMVIVVGVLIVGFVFSSVGDEFLTAGYLLGDCLKLFLHTCLLLAAVFAFMQTRKLDINMHPASLLDDVLLYICLPAFFMETAFSLVATISILNVVKSLDFVIMVTQAVLQTALLVDGLRRCSNSKKLRRTKPGREVVMFLVIANVGMWLVNTFSYKSPESLDERYVFYGKVVWSILGHVTLPLIMFYRFHSSVCFADMWDAAYKPGSGH